MKNLRLVFILPIIISFVGYAFADELSKETKITLIDYALSEQGIEMEDFHKVFSDYYQHPQPKILLSIIKAILSREELANDPNIFNTIAHFSAAVAQDNPSFAKALKDLQLSSTGSKKAAMDKIIAEVDNFQSPQPDSPENLDYLWSEFIATGKKEPVEKIISVLGKPADTLDEKLNLSAAEWSLGANARQYKSVYQIIQNEDALATGALKEKLGRILQENSNTR